jgi:protein-disulfide isomerase
LSKRELLRQKAKDQKRKRWLTFGWIAGVIILAFVFIISLPRLIMRANSYDGSTGLTLGDPDAPVIVEIFSSYYCSHCKDFSEQSEKKFIENYVDTGKVYYRYINIPPQTDQSILGSIASYCAAEQNRFFDYKELLYTYASASDGFSVDNLEKYANFIGLDIDEFSQCLNADTYAKAYINDLSYASSLGINFTPAFTVNGQVVTAADLDETVESFLSQD